MGEPLVGTLLVLILIGIISIITLLIRHAYKLAHLPVVAAQPRLPKTLAIDESTINISEADIVFSPGNLDAAEADLSEVGFNITTIEPILKMIPSLASIATSSGQIFRISFSPEITKGLAEGNFQLMKSAGNLKAVAVDKAGKIVGQGNITADRLVTSVAVVSAAWQVLAIVTAQKFLSDIYKKLASIEEGVQRLQAWLQEEEQGRYLGNMKYLSDISRGFTKELNPEQTAIFKNQLELIYRESLQAIEANMIRSTSALEKLKLKRFDGNLEKNEVAFRREMDAYFRGVSYIIKFRHVAVITEYMSAVIDRKPGSEIGRIQINIQDAESLLEKVKLESEEMQKKSFDVSGGLLDSKTNISETGKNLRREMESLVVACQESTKRVIEVSESGNKLRLFVDNNEQNGLQLIVEIGKNGVNRVYSAKQAT